MRGADMENLSHLAHGLTGGESQNSSNMISDPPPFGAPGSYSEATAGEPVGHPGGVDYPPLAGDRPNVVNGPADAGPGWNYVQGVNHG